MAEHVVTIRPHGADCYPPIIVIFRTYPGDGPLRRWEVIEDATGRVVSRAMHRGDPYRPSNVREGEPMVPLMRGFSWKEEV